MDAIGTPIRPISVLQCVQWDFFEPNFGALVAAGCGASELACMAVARVSCSAADQPSQDGATHPEKCSPL